MEDLYPFGDRLLPLLSPEYSSVFNFLTFLYNHLTYYSKDFFKKIEIFCNFFVMIPGHAKQKKHGT